MDDAGLPPQTEDECVEVGGSTLAALLLEPLHQPQAHSGYLFGVVKSAPAAIASRNSMGSYNGEEDDGPTKTTVVLSHARGTDPSLSRPRSRRRRRGSSGFGSRDPPRRPCPL